jgi:hypothetical protein
MKLETDENGEIVLSDVFNGIGIKTDAGTFGIAQRDGGIEVMLSGKLVYPPVHLKEIVSEICNNCESSVTSLQLSCDDCPVRKIAVELSK